MTAIANRHSHGESCFWTANRVASPRIPNWLPLASVLLVNVNVLVDTVASDGSLEATLTITSPVGWGPFK